jgi:hypothetical protein
MIRVSNVWLTSDVRLADASWVGTFIAQADATGPASVEVGAFVIQVELGPEVVDLPGGLSGGVFGDRFLHHRQGRDIFSRVA